MMENAGLPLDPLHYTMTLFVTGATKLSLLAIENVQDFCAKELAGRYDLEVVDLYRSPERAKEAQIVAAPTLLREKPTPKRVLIGNMSDRSRLKAAMEVG